MSMELVQIHIDEMQVIQAEEKLSRFEDTVMANPYIDDKERQKYLHSLQNHIKTEKVKTTQKAKLTAHKANLLQLQMMGIGVELK